MSRTTPRSILRRTVCTSLLAALCFPAATAWADVRAAALFTDNLVLQRSRPIPVWGRADSGESVTVTLGKDSASTVAGSDGKWTITLPQQKAATGLKLTITGKNTQTLNNVAVGEVWVCSGQSNMEWPVEKSRDADAEIAAATTPDIRLFTVRKATSTEPKPDVRALDDSWAVCDPTTVRKFSAVAYFFGRELHRELGVPVGLIDSTWGGTPAEAWTSRPALEASPDLRPLFPDWEARIAAHPAALSVYESETLPKWELAAEKAKAEGKRIPSKPNPPDGPGSASRPTVLYNAMIAPLMPYAIKGVIWYQGEGNGDSPERAIQYRTLFPAMIRDWRTNWKQGDFPFLFVQLAGWLAVQTKPVENDDWAILREAQANTLSLPHTGMATAIDLADADRPYDIHPKNKQDVGRRLALVALANEYDRKTAYSGPVLERMEIKDSEARLRFRHTDGGLRSRDGGPLRGFAIAGADGVWKWADAVIKGDTVTLSSAEVSAPTAVRYNWARNPIGSLTNGVGLPAFPFRTDTRSDK
ncbi:MAG: sialate O-acetylesterase [Akkermansiaceae bacterium]|nr:sialate O-acetylesterase [Armatimonadota bacterium]